MPVSKIRLFSKNFLERRDGGLKLILIDVVLGFVEEIVQRR